MDEITRISLQNITRESKRKLFPISFKDFIKEEILKSANDGNDKIFINFSEARSLSNQEKIIGIKISSPYQSLEDRTIQLDTTTMGKMNIFIRSWFEDLDIEIYGYGLKISWD